MFNSKKGFLKSVKKKTKKNRFTCPIENEQKFKFLEGRYPNDQ